METKQVAREQFFISLNSNPYLNFAKVKSTTILATVKSMDNGMYFLYTQDATDSPRKGVVSYTFVNKAAEDYIFMYLFVTSHIYYGSASKTTENIEWNSVV